jgi:hypothetical protein
MRWLEVRRHSLRKRNPVGFDDGTFVSVQFRRAPAELLPGSFTEGGR